MAIFVLRDSARGTDYLAGDVVEVFDDMGPDPYTGEPAPTAVNLPPASPFWVVKITGITREQAAPYFTPEYNADGSVAKKRLWQLRQQNVPNLYKNQLLNNRYLGFGSPEDRAYYGVSGDYAVSWEEARTWLYNKATKQTA